MAANVDLYQNELRRLITDPSSFSGSPGFRFALDQGTQAISRASSANRGSGNVLAELMKYGTGLAAQDYGDTVDRLGRLSGQEQQYDLGLGQNENTRRRGDQDFGLGLLRAGTERELGIGELEGRNWQRRADFRLGQGRNATDWYRARTDRGRARSDDWWNQDRSTRDWFGTV